jgi:hypothetical protein
MFAGSRSAYAVDFAGPLYPAAVRIEEGRLLERRCPHCGDVERRAFGESESKRGELASYAIGWTSGHEDEVGYMTIGIGAGNPGGGSFHIQIRMAGDEWGMQLVDVPFEDVPEGGPDLTREEALAHGDLPYVWFVADHVMTQDRRAMWMEHWLRKTRAFVSASVLENPESVRRVVRDEDGEWQLFEDFEGDPGEPELLHLFHLLDADTSLREVLDLEPGQAAERPSPGKAWVRLKG